MATTAWAGRDGRVIAVGLPSELPEPQVPLGIADAAIARHLADAKEAVSSPLHVQSPNVE